MKSIKKLGISTYPEKAGEKETIEYLKLAYKFGFRRVFGNLLGIKNDDEGKKKLKMYQRVYTMARNLGFEVTLDVNPNVFKELGLKKDDYLFAKKIGATTIRYDEDFKGVVESKVSKKLMVELNASANLDTIINTVKLGGKLSNLIASHNFYPMQYTGVSFAKFISQSTKIHSMGIRVAAFIGLDKKYKGFGPWNTNDGLTSIEALREKSTIEQLRDMLGFDFLTDISFGEQTSIKHAKELFPKVKKVYDDYINFTNSKDVVLRVKLKSRIKAIEKEILFKNNGKPHINRVDYNDYFFRSTMPRIYFANETIKPSNSGKIIKPGDVIIINENKGRYKGEMHIYSAILDDRKDNFRNIVATVDPRDINKIFWIKDTNKKLIFKVVNEKI